MRLMSWQKKWLEWPLIICVAFILQFIEFSFLQLPGDLGVVRFLPVIIAFMVIEMDFLKMIIVCLILSLLFHVNFADDASAYVAGLILATYICKFFLRSFTVSSRAEFCILSTIFFVAHFFIVLVIHLFKGSEISFLNSFYSLLVLTVVNLLLSVLLYGVLKRWFKYFEHQKLSSSNADLV